MSTAVPSRAADGGAPTILAAGGGVDCHPYDFRHPNRVSKELERSLNTLHDSFARSLATSLSGYLRVLVEARVKSLTQLTYGEFLESLPNPTAMAPVALAPAEGGVVFEISPRLIFQMIDRLMGGEGDPIDPVRELTAIEKNVAVRIFQRILSLWTEMWGNVTPVEAELQGLETVPQMVQVVAPSELTIVVSVEVRLRENAELLTICLPFMVVEPLLTKIASAPGYATGTRRAASAPAQVARQVQRAQVMVTAYLGRTRISLAQLVGLRAGDLLLLNQGPGDAVEIWVQGRPVFLGTAGSRRGSRAVSVRESLAQRSRG